MQEVGGKGGNLAWFLVLADPQPGSNLDLAIKTPGQETQPTMGDEMWWVHILVLPALTGEA
jgi:hypothetical protein